MSNRLSHMGNFDSLPERHTLKVHTKAPSKYLLVDTETNQIYQGQVNAQWDWRLITQDPTLVEELCASLPIKS